MNLKSPGNRCPIKGSGDSGFDKRVGYRTMNRKQRFRAYLSQKWLGTLMDWRPYIEKPIPDDELNTVMRQASIPTFGFFFLLILSTAIATLGLISNSAPAIIGAMIIAPLMGPIMGFSYGITIFELKQIRRSLMLLMAGVFLVVLFAYLSTEMIGLRIAGSEILSRTAPTLLDLGVAVAAGGAGAFAYTRRSIMNSIAGVAISVALVPPLAVTGIGLSLRAKATADVGLSLSEIGLYSGGTDIAGGAFILFTTNLAAIVIIAGIVFVSQGYGHWKKAFMGIVLVMAISGLLLQPLGESLQKLYVKSRVLRLMAKLPVTHPDLFAGVGWLESLNVNYRKGQLYIDVDGFVPRDKIGNFQESQFKTDFFRNHLEESLGEPVNLEVEMVPIDILHFKSGPAFSEQP